MSTFAVSINIIFCLINVSCDNTTTNSVPTSPTTYPSTILSTATLSPNAHLTQRNASYLLIQLPMLSFRWSDAWSEIECQLPQYPSNSTGDAWCAANNLDANSYLQANLGSLYYITSVSTWGRDSISNQFVTSYHLSYSIDGDTFIPYGILTGNYDTTQEKKNALVGDIIAQYLRFTPITWSNWKSMRIEASGFEYLPFPKPFDTISSHPDIYGKYHDIGWIKMISCTDGNYNSTFTIHRSDYELLATQAISIKFQIPNGSIDDNMTLIAKPYSNPILHGLNKKKEVSYTYDVNGDVIDQVNIINWIGTSTALDRLRQTCVANGRVYDLNERIYQACGNSLGLHIMKYDGLCLCKWENTNLYLKRDIEIYFGFKPPTLDPTLTPTTVPSLSPSTAPTHRPTLTPTNSPSLSPSLMPTESPTRYPTITDPYDSYFEVTYNISFKYQSHINYIRVHFTQSLQRIQEIIERGYATNNNVKLILFRDFWLKITSINGQIIQDPSKNNEFFNLEEQDILMAARVECPLHVCQEIFDNTDIALFEKNVTKQLNDYFKMYQLQELNGNVDGISNSQLILKFCISEMSAIQFSNSSASETESYIPWWIWLIISVIIILLLIVLYKYKQYQKSLQIDYVQEYGQTNIEIEGDNDDDKTISN